MNLESLSSEDLSYLSDLEIVELQRLFKLTPHHKIDLHELWRLMDIVWDELKCDNRNIDQKKIEKYYQHPIWLLNGLFIENHELSLENRQAIVDWMINHLKINKLIDFGGGTGTLDRMISRALPNLSIDIYEPFPSQYALNKSELFNNINFIDKVNSKYDCLICTDVLEHVSDPILLLTEMISFVKAEGYLVIANHFFPSIKCHLPCTFHLRYTFNTFTKLLGLIQIESIQNGYIKIYQKKQLQEIDWALIRKQERQSKMIFPINEFKYNFIPRCIGKLKKALEFS
ncbi:MAG: methyltransferase domain-containing protein [Cyanobacteria bacterium P01_D01_bin.156]